MNVWILVTLIATGGLVLISDQVVYDDLASCFEARENIIQELGRPIVDYQAICVNKTGKKK
tara:strand:+ start:1612 stop:1794 length:183 start_codon:yes stop_codon:yes gene_type:complete